MVVTRDGFPHGVLCGTCRTPIPDGHPYSLAPEAMTRDGIPIETINCVTCHP